MQWQKQQQEQQEQQFQTLNPKRLGSATCTIISVSMGIFFSIYSDFQLSKFVSLGHLYSFPLPSSNSSLVFLSLFLSLLSSNFLSSLPVSKYSIFTHVQTILNNSLLYFPQYLKLLNPSLGEDVEKVIVGRWGLMVFMMHMLRWMSIHTLNVKIWNKDKNA